MYHVVGVPPEAPTGTAAFGRRRVPEPVVFGEAEQRAWLERTARNLAIAELRAATEPTDVM